MAMDPKRRQKKLERRKAKKRAQRPRPASHDTGSIAARLEAASDSPILHCCVAAEIWEEGIGNVLLSRSLSNGQVAFAVFLVDLYCLGVKDLFMNVAPRARYDRDLYRKLAQKSELEPLRPECARKLVEGAVRYALDLGIPPHPDYRKAKPLFGTVPAEDCTREFTYGKDGKPLFVAGPCDNDLRCDQILRTLHRHCGPDGYHYIIPLHDPLSV
jgi:hypothetical protein